MRCLKAPSYLIMNSKGYFFRIRVPKHLQPVFKKKELKKAIHATDRNLALRQSILYAAKVLELFDKLQEVSMAKLPFLNDSRLIIKRDGHEFITDGGASVHASVFGRSWSKAQED